MTTTTFSSPVEFASRSPALAAKSVRRLQIAAVEEIAGRFSKVAVEATPVGSAERGDRHPGFMRSSWRRAKGIPGVEAIANAAPYAGIIDRGRKRGVTPKGAKSRSRARKGAKLKPNKASKMLGSTQAPQGITRPVWRLIRRNSAAITEKAIARAEREV